MKVPPAYLWGGQFENQQLADTRLAFVVPVSSVINFAAFTGTLQFVRQITAFVANLGFVPTAIGFLGAGGLSGRLRERLSETWNGDDFDFVRCCSRCLVFSSLVKERICQASLCGESGYGIVE